MTSSVFRRFKVNSGGKGSRISATDTPKLAMGRLSIRELTTYPIQFELLIPTVLYVLLGTRGLHAQLYY